MNRLTNKEYCRCEDFIFPLGNAWVTTKKNDKAIYEKLKSLEDIEEELGIDLITLFKALKEGIFVAYDSAFETTNKPKIKITKDTATGICYRDKKWYIQENETFLKDYGKTWSLTKEELEDGKRI